MTHTVLTVTEVWHCRKRGHHLVRGDVITDPDEVAELLASEHAHSVRQRMAHSHEVEEIEKLLKAKAAFHTDEAEAEMEHE